MIRKFSIIFYLLLMGCTSSPEVIDLPELSYLLNIEVDKNNEILLSIIKEKESQVNQDSIYDIFKRRTQEYCHFLEELKQISNERQINPFFKHQEMTSVGETFRKKSIDYIETVNTLYANTRLGQIANNFLNLKDVLIEENLYADYIHYYYAGMSKDLFIYNIGKREEKVLMFQNEVLSWMLSKRYLQD